MGQKRECNIHLYVTIIHLFNLLCLLQGSSASSDDDDDDALDVPAAVGITFVVTVLITVAATLLIVYIVYKLKKRSTRSEVSVVNTRAIATASSKKATITSNTSSYDNENYEFPENFQQPKVTSRYQSNPITTLQVNPAYGVTKASKNSEKIYENLK